MHLRMHNNNFDLLLRSIHYKSAELQIAKIQKDAQNIKCYLLQRELGVCILI